MENQVTGLCIIFAMNLESHIHIEKRDNHQFCEAYRVTHSKPLKPKDESQS